jgi:hypothetical protein
MMKPRVKYIDIAYQPEVGKSVWLFTYDHYRSALRGWIRTSTIQKVMPQATGPVIETLNTIYWPHETDESNPYMKENRLERQI